MLNFAICFTYHQISHRNTDKHTRTIPIHIFKPAVISLFYSYLRLPRYVYLRSRPLSLPRHAPSFRSRGLEPETAVKIHVRTLNCSERSV
jgi:hypothetical protein